MHLLALTLLLQPRAAQHRKEQVIVYKKKCCKKYKDSKACKRCPIRRKRS